MLGDVSILNALDMEYVDKIIFALHRANERLAESLQNLNVKIETFKEPTDTNPEEPVENKPSGGELSSERLIENMSESDA